MKKLILLLFLPFFCVACDSKKGSLIDSQKLINKQLIGLQDSLNRVSDSADHVRMTNEVHALQQRFDSLGRELEKMNKK